MYNRVGKNRTLEWCFIITLANMNLIWKFFHFIFFDLQYIINNCTIFYCYWSWLPLLFIILRSLIHLPWRHIRLLCSVHIAYSVKNWEFSFSFVIFCCCMILGFLEKRESGGTEYRSHLLLLTKFINVFISMVYISASVIDNIVVIVNMMLHVCLLSKCISWDIRHVYGFTLAKISRFWFGFEEKTRFLVRYSLVFQSAVVNGCLAVYLKPVGAC